MKRKSKVKEVKKESPREELRRLRKLEALVKKHFFTDEKKEEIPLEVK